MREESNEMSPKHRGEDQNDPSYLISKALENDMAMVDKRGSIKTKKRNREVLAPDNARKRRSTLRLIKSDYEEF